MKVRFLLCLLCLLWLNAGCTAPLSFEITHVPREEIFLPAVSSAPTAVSLPVPTETPYYTPEPTPDVSIPVYATSFTLTEEDLVLAAKVAYWEARGKGEEAYRAVLSVIYNRCMTPRFGGGMTLIFTEVYRRGQFSVINRSRFRKVDPPEEIVEYARDVFESGNINIPYNILFFCDVSLGPDFGGRKLYKNIGGNLFFYASTERRT